MNADGSVFATGWVTGSPAENAGSTHGHCRIHTHCVVKKTTVNIFRFGISFNRSTVGLHFFSGSKVLAFFLFTREMNNNSGDQDGDQNSIRVTEPFHTRLVLEKIINNDYEKRNID